MAVINKMATMSDAENKLQKLLFGPQIGAMLYTVLDLNIPHILNSGPKTVEELSQITSTSPKKLERVLFALETTEIFDYNPHTKQFTNTLLSSAFLDENYAGCTKMCLLPFRYDLLSVFPESLKTNSSLPQIKHNKTYLEYLVDNPLNMEKYVEGAANHVKLTAPGITRAINLSNVNKVLDVGGYDATLLIELAKEYPQISGAVYNETHFRPIANKKIEESNMTNRIKALAGNYIDAVPNGYEVIILENVLRTFSDNLVLSILKNCAKALISGSKFYCIDYILDKAHENYQFERILDIKVMGLNNGKVRNKEEIEDLFERAGLTVASYSPAYKQWVIEADVK